MSLYYLPYKMGSQSVTALKEKLGGLKIKKDGNYAFKPHHLVVNWGTGSAPYWAGGAVSAGKRLLNRWDKVAVAVNKLKAFLVLLHAGVPVPDFTDNKDTAKKWAKSDVVFCRTLVSSMEGKGIVIATKAEEVIDAPLYTRLFPKDKEYRVHVFNGKVIDFVQKKLKNGALEIPGRSKYVRNTANGWIFARQGVTLPESAAVVAVNAIKAIGLDFGAVDLAVNKSGSIVVFEINTAPGLEGTTVDRYSEAILNYYKAL